MLTTIFAPRDSVAYPPCGMFTLPHFIALFATLAIVALCLYACRSNDAKRIKFKTKIVAVAVTVMEIIKISYNFAYGYTWPDAWVPLAFCSLFIYATWMAGFGKGTVEKLGVSFLMGGCPVAGLAFLIFPSTSLQMHPIYHYLCIHSLVFHGLMVWLGLLYIIRSGHKVNLKAFAHYAIFCLAWAIPALVLNRIFNCNMMFLREPFNVPIQFIKELHKSSQVLYTFLILCAYLACYSVSYGVYRLCEHVKAKQSSKAAQEV